MIFSRYQVRQVLNIVALYIAFFSIISCSKDEESYVESSGIKIKDEHGRQLILHGLNTSETVKFSSYNYLPWVKEKDVEREAADFGFNFVRLLTSWVAIEPQKGVYDEVYLRKFDEIIKWYTDRGIYVMIDMHQDLYGEKVGGNGAPDWACVTDNATPVDWPAEIPWWVKNIDPMVINSWVNFWEYKEHKFLQDHYVGAWTLVVNRYKDNPYVIGYDLMNEPVPGDLIKLLSGDFEKKWLPDLYDKLIKEIRKVDKNKYIFIEPIPAQVSFGFPSFLRKIEDEIFPSRLVYAPHLYPAGLHEGGAYSQNDKRSLGNWVSERKKELVRQGNIPLLTGEFGVHPNSPGFDEFIKDVHTQMDENLWHWSYWSNDFGWWAPLNPDLSESPIANHLIRSFPRATAGELISFSFDMESRVFKMKYRNNKNISEPTEIVLPKRWYPNGYHLMVSGTKKYTTGTNKYGNVLELKVDDFATVEVEISPK